MNTAFKAHVYRYDPDSVPAAYVQSYEVDLHSGMTVLELLGDGKVWKRKFGSLERSLVFTPTTEGFAGDCVYALQAHVVAGVLDGAPFENLARDYLTVVAIEEAVYRSDAEGCKLAL